MSESSTPGRVAATAEQTAIPAELRERPQWVIWRWGQRGGKRTKIPLSARRISGTACFPRQSKPASTTDPSTWTIYADAARLAAEAWYGASGIGYVFSEDDPFVGIDLDQCRRPETGIIEPWALDIIRDLNSYSEVSPSGTGVHVYVRGKVPPGGNRRGAIEIYSEGRYFTVTAQHVEGTPLTIEDRQRELDALHARIFADRTAATASGNGPRPSTAASASDAELIERAKRAKNGEAFTTLWVGDTSGYPSASEADLALASMLAFWAGNDPARIDALFRQSGLYRAKWDRPDYSGRTIAAAITGTTETYREPRSERMDSGSTTTPSATPFPMEALPPVLRLFCDETASALPVAVDMIGAAVLAVASGAIGMTRLARVKDGWTESAAVNVAIVAPSGAIKTPMLARAAAPLRARQTEQARAHREQMAQYEADLATHARAVDAYRKQQSDDLPEKPTEPAMKRTWTADTTIERLAGLLVENPRGLILIRDELSAWVRSLNQYRGGKGADKQFYLSVFSSAPVAVDRQGKAPILIDRPFLSVVGNVPPDVLPDLNDECGREDGFLPRILFSFPDPVPVRWSETVVNPATERAYHTLIQALLGLLPEPAPAGEVRPMILDMTPEARALFIRWHDEHCAMMESPSLSADLRPFYAKFRGYCARLALIHTLCTDPLAKEIPAESVGAAADLIEYFKGQTQRVAPLLARVKQSPEARCEREIVRALTGGHVLTRREIQRTGNSTAASFNEALTALLAAGQVIETEKPGDRGPRKAYRLAED